MCTDLSNYCLFGSEQSLSGLLDVVSSVVLPVKHEYSDTPVVNG